MTGAVLVAAVCAFVLHRVRRRRRLKDLPRIPLAPGTLPVIGNLGVVKAYARDLLHKKHEEAAAAAGDAGVLRVCVLGHTRLALTTPATFAAVLRRGVFLPKPAGFYNVFMMLGIKRMTLLLDPREKESARVRSHLMRALSADTVAASMGLLSDTVQRSIAAISRCAVAGPAAEEGPQRRPSVDASDPASGVCWGDVNSDGVLVDMFPLAAANILTVVFKVFMEVDIIPPMAVFTDCLAHASSVAAHPLQFSLLRLGLYPGRRRYRRNFETLYNFHKELVRLIYDRPMPEGSTKVWAALRSAFPSALEDRKEYEDMLANVTFLYGASYETASNSAMHTIAALALDQDSQTALAEELGAVGLLATADNPLPRSITAEDLGKLTVLDAIVHESLRLMPTAPNGGLRVLTSDTEIGGYLVPKGTEVMASSWSLHYNTRVWGADAAQWRPDRWLEGESVAAVRKDADGNLRFQPFLTGASNCVGQHLAMAELKMVVASMVSRLHVAVDAKRMPHLRTVEDYVGEAVTRITLQRSSPCWLRMRPRVPT